TTPALDKNLKGKGALVPNCCLSMAIAITTPLRTSCSVCMSVVNLSNFTLPMTHFRRAIFRLVCKQSAVIADLFNQIDVARSTSTCHLEMIGPNAGQILPSLGVI